MLAPTPPSRARLLWEIAAIISITALTAFLRFYGLSALPPGMHGDESVLGLLAEQIWREGSIGVYSPLGGGHPTGPEYLYAAPVHYFGNTMFAVRFAPAFFATLTVPALYLLLRRYVDEKSPFHFALLAAFLLAILNWHIHFSRIAFPLIIWPFCVLLAMAATLEAVRRPTSWRWILAGFVAAAGLYIYNAQLLFLLPLGIFVTAWLVWQNQMRWRDKIVFWSAWMVAIILTALPMALALRASGAQFSRDSIFVSAEWQTQAANAGVPAKVGFLAKRYGQFWIELVRGLNTPDPIRVDASDVTPLVRPPLFLLFFIGIFLSWKRRHEPFFQLAALMLLLIPLGYVATTGGLARRSFALVPLVAAFAAYGAFELLSLLQRRFGAGSFFRWTASISMSVLLVCIIWQNLRDYFVIAANSPEMSWTYCEEFTQAVHYIQSLPPDSHVYFLSERWSFNYEPRQFLAPDARGEDRSREYGRFDLGFDPRGGRPVFVCVGDYAKEALTLRDRYPNGLMVVGPPLYRDANQPTFYAYWPQG